ncbi:MAG: phosphatase PAP2 family protein, partial [Terriglobales bacterium]
GAAPTVWNAVLAPGLSLSSLGFPASEIHRTRAAFRISAGPKGSLELKGTIPATLTDFKITPPELLMMPRPQRDSRAGGHELEAGQTAVSAHGNVARRRRPRALAPAMAVLVGLLMLTPAAHAASPWSVVRGTIARLWSGTLRFPGAAGRHWRVAAMVAGVSAALILFADAPVSSRIQSPELERASNAWSNRGLLGIEPAFALTADAIENRCLFCRSTGKFALTAAAADAYATASVTALKYAAGRERPDTPEDGDGGFNEGGTSFPSGHTIGAFTLAALLARQDPRARWAAGIAYLLAGGIGAARVTAKEHFPSDVAVGATLGLLLGRCAADCPDAAGR